MLELFHGPTLAFKDLAMQLLGRLMDHVLKARGGRATIVGATSGDTGSAAVEAFRGLDQVDVFILYPHGRVSDVQRRQMTTVDELNVHALAVEGTFDDCQAIVKGLFNHARFRDELTSRASTRSIGRASPRRRSTTSPPPWRLAGRTGSLVLGPDRQFRRRLRRLGRQTHGAADRAHHGRPPTPTTSWPGRFTAGAYEVRAVTPTTSPVHGHPGRLQLRAAPVRGAWARRGGGARPDAQSGAIARLHDRGGAAGAHPPEFSSRAVDEASVADEIGATWREAGYLLDPHTAIGVRAARSLLAERSETPVVALATAHPAKFPEAVERATGRHPALPPHLADLIDRRERFTVLPNDQAAVERFIRDHARAVRGAAA